MRAMMGVNTDQNVIVIVMVAKASPGISARRRLLPRTRATPNRDAENPSAANRYFKHRQTKTATATKTPPPLLFGRAPKKKHTHTHSRSTKRSKRSRGRSFRSSPFLLLRPLCSLSLSPLSPLSPSLSHHVGPVSRAEVGQDAVPTAANDTLPDVPVHQGVAHVRFFHPRRHRRRRRCRASSSCRCVHRR